jgi:hypothetical protein
MPARNLNLKLIGKSTGDLKTISAYLQDSIVLIKDIIFLKENKIFIMIVNRFMWEDIEKGLFRESKRIRCALKFDRVQRVTTKNINQKKKDKPLEFLAIEDVFRDEKLNEIKLIFSGGGIISVFAEEIDCLLDDQGKPWTVKKIPRHQI